MFPVLVLSVLVITGVGVTVGKLTINAAGVAVGFAAAAPALIKAVACTVPSHETLPMHAATMTSNSKYVFLCNMLLILSQVRTLRSHFDGAFALKESLTG